MHGGLDTFGTAPTFFGQKILGTRVESFEKVRKG